MAWDLFDFVVFGALVAVVAIAYFLVTKLSGNSSYRAGAGVALAGAFLLVWVNGAVGIVGDENNDANLLYFGVLAIGILGSVLVRFRALGLARVLIAMACAQVLVALVALAIGQGARGPSWPGDVIVLTLFFAAIWLLSAWLFRRAHRQINRATPANH